MRVRVKSLRQRLESSLVLIQKEVCPPLLQQSQLEQAGLDCLVVGRIELRWVYGRWLQVYWL